MPSVDKLRQELTLFGRLDAVKQLHAERRAEVDTLLPVMLDRAFRGEL